MNNFAYVVSLYGKNVHHSWSTQAIIKNFDDLDKVRDTIKNRYNIEFDELVSCRIPHCYMCFDNISDNRDIKLIVERVDIVE